MKYLRTYNESVRDEMTPKSKEDIVSDLKKLDPDKKLLVGYEYELLWLIKLGLEEGGEFSGHAGYLLMDFAKVNGREDIIQMLKDRGVDSEEDMGIINKVIPNRKVDESVRDMMTPKSDDDIENSIKEMPFYRAGKVYNSLIGKGTGKIPERVLKHLPLIARCHQAVKFNHGINVDKYLTEGWKYSDYRKQDDPENLTNLSFTMFIGENKRRLSQHKTLKYLHCSYKNPTNNKLDIMEIKSLREFNRMIDDMCGMNESIKDKMTGKSIEDVKKAIDKLHPDDKIAHITRYDLKDYYTKKELSEMFNRTATRIAGILMKDYEYHYEDNAYQWALSHMDDIMELITKGWALSDVVYCVMMGRDKESPQDEMEEEDTNESVKELMTPKSKEIVDDLLRGLTQTELNRKLMFALGRRDIGMIETMLDHGADVHMDNDWPIRYMTSHNETEIIELLNKYTDTNESVRDKMTPKSKEEILKRLEGKPYLLIVNTLKRYDMKLDDFYTKEEQEKMDRYSFSYVDDYEELIFIDEKRIREVLSVVGEGVNDVDVYTQHPYPNDYQNEVYVTFHDNAWGGISLKEWNRLEDILSKLKGKNGLYYYEIDPQSARATLRFDSKYPLEEI